MIENLNKGIYGKDKDLPKIDPRKRRGIKR
jgi:hypothetical protein